MDEQAQRIAIAESLGWIECELYRPPPEVHIDDPCFTPRSFLRGFKPGVTLWQPIPDYLNSLDAMFEVEKTLDEGQQDTFLITLKRVVEPGLDDFQKEFNAIHATAKQRAEAYLRAIGRWQETTKAAA